MITLNFKKRHIGFIIRVVYNKGSYQHLFARLAAALKANASAKDTDVISVQCTEPELISMIRELSSISAGITTRVNKEMKDDLLPQIGAGIQAEGAGEEPVLDGDGNEQYTTPLDPNETPVLITRPKQWMRIATALTTSDNNDQAVEDKWVAEGLEIGLQP